MNKIMMTVAVASLAAAVRADGWELSVTPVESAGAVAAYDVDVSGGTSANSVTLVAAYGPVSGGETPAGWLRTAKVGEISAGAGRLRFPVPEGWGTDLLNLRFFLYSGSAPYRAEVEYLKSNGRSAFPDLGYKLSNSSKVVCKFKYAVASGGRFIGSADNKYRFFGISWGAFLDLMGDQGNQRIQFDPYDPSFAYTVEFGNHYVYSVDWGYYFRTGDFIPLDPNPLDSPLAMMNEDDYGTIYYLNIRENDTDGDAAQYVPVVTWDGHTALYEKVGGVVYAADRENGRVDFEPGPVVSSAELLAVSPETAVLPTFEPLDPNYAHYFDLLSLGYSGTSTLMNFPVLVRLSQAAVEGFRYEDVKSEGGYDLKFMDFDGNVLKFEIDTWNPNGESLVWVQVPRLTGMTRLRCFYGRTGVTADPSTSAVWTDAGYFGVWHMNGMAGNDDVVDASGHGLTAQARAGSNGDTSLMSVVEGVVGAARNSGHAQSVSAGNYLSIPSYDGVIDELGRDNYRDASYYFTVSGWFRLNSGENVSSARLLSRKTSYSEDNYWEVELSNAPNQLNARGRGHDNANVSASVPSLAADWVYLTFVYDQAVFRVFANGSFVTQGTITRTRSQEDRRVSVGNNASGGEVSFAGAYDELRFRYASPTAGSDWVAAEYDTVRKPGFLVALPVNVTDESSPIFSGRPTVEPDGDGGLLFKAVLASGIGDVYAVLDGTEEILVAQGADATEAPVELSIAIGTGTNTTRAFAAKAVNGDYVTSCSGGAFYDGELVVAKSSDCDEFDTSVPGVFTVSRADAALDLVVNYTLGGTAVPNVNFDDANEVRSVTIPAGSTSATVEIYPLLDGMTKADTTVELALAPGAYGGVGSGAALTIAELAPPAGFSTWMGTAGDDGYADMTDPTNWSDGELPGKDDVVLLDGRFSQANLVWNTASVPTVAGWSQTDDFTGTIAFDIPYPNDVSVPSGDGALEIAGDVAIAGGTWTMSACADSADTRRLAVKVGGSLTISEGATIDVTLRGAKGGHERAGCYGGDNGAFGKTYGDPKRPFWCGSGNGAEDSRAGGAVWLEVAGAVQLDGSIVANGSNGSSGGSVYLKAASLSGSGQILVNGNSHGGNGSGGRIAVELTTAALSESFTIPGSFQAYGCSGGASMPGAGTIVVKNPGESNGTLYVCNNPSPAINRWNSTFGSKQDELTTLPAGSEWTFDRVVTGHYGALAVGTDTTLNLPNGFASLASAGGMANASSVMLCGGVVNAPAVGGVHTFRNGAFFYPASGYAFDTDVVIESGAAIGASYVRKELEEKRCTFVVNGSLTVNEGGSIDVSRGGFGMSPGSYSYTSAGCHGGQAANYADNCAYGSVFNPLLSGGSNSGNGDDPQVGAGVLELSVSGALVVDGTVTARGSTSVFFGGSSGQAGGSINIVAGSLSGQGEISADGSEGFWADDNLRWNLGKGYTRGGGGRIAIRLTDPAATFGTFDTTKITARGWNSNHHVAGDFDKTPLSSSAGTIYLETAKDGDKGGLIRVANRGTAEEADWPHSVTCLPAGTLGDAADDFRHASLAVADAARVKLFADLRMKAVELGSGASLDLNGKCLKVGRAVIGGSKLAPGVYAASELAALVDSSAGADGTLVVTGSGLVVIVK